MLKNASGWVLVTILALLGINAWCEEPVPATESIDWIKITSKASLAHLGSLDSFDITEGGTKAAQALLNYLEKKDPNEAKLAVEGYQKIIPNENFGGEYSTLQWFGEYFLAPESQKEKMLSDRYIRSFFEYLSTDDFAPLKEYIQRKYKIGPLAKMPRTEQTQKREAVLENLIVFNNPKREQWEKSSKIIDVLDLKKGDRIADVGSGPGYYTFKFADLVGNEGHVYAIDLDTELLNYIKKVKETYNIPNVEPVETKSNTIGIPEKSVNVVFMCSLYHVVYLTSLERVKDQFIDSIKKALKPDGSLVIVDNALVQESELPYHGPYIAKELVIAQLKHYGFHLVSNHAFIPQRYVLIFKAT